MDRFKVIDGDQKPRGGKSKAAPTEFLVCKCGSSETVETQTMRPVAGNRIGKGRKAIRCYSCGAILKD